MIVNIAFLVIGFVMFCIGAPMAEPADYYKKPNYFKVSCGAALEMIGAIIFVINLFILFPGLLPGYN